MPSIFFNTPTHGLERDFPLSTAFQWREKAKGTAPEETNQVTQATEAA